MIPNVVVEYSDRNHMRDTRFASFLLFTGIYDHVYPSSTYFVPAIPILYLRYLIWYLRYLICVFSPVARYL